MTLLPASTIPDYIYPDALVRLRDGTKARIYATNTGDDKYPIHGSAWFPVQGRWVLHQWTINGVSLADLTDPMDIVGPWVEPPVEVIRWAVYKKDNFFRGSYDRLSDAEYDCSMRGDYIVKLTGTLPTRDK